MPSQQERVDDFELTTADVESDDVALRCSGEDVISFGLRQSRS